MDHRSDPDELKGLIHGLKYKEQRTMSAKQDNNL